MSARLDSESDHRFVRLYKDLQEAAQRFWTTPQEMNHHFSTITAFELSAYPTPIMPTTTTPTSPAETPAVFYILLPIIPPSPEYADPRDPNLGCPHRTSALAPLITVATPIYNLFSLGTAEQTRHMSQICIPTGWQVTPGQGTLPTTPHYFAQSLVLHVVSTTSNLSVTSAQPSHHTCAWRVA